MSSRLASMPLRAIVALVAAAALALVLLAGSLSLLSYRTQVLDAARVDAQASPLLTAATRLSFERGQVVSALADYWAQPSDASQALLRVELAHALAAETDLDDLASSFASDALPVTGEEEIALLAAEAEHDGATFEAIVSDALDPSTPSTLTFARAGVAAHGYLDSVTRLSRALSADQAQATESLLRAASVQQWLLAALAVFALAAIAVLWWVLSRLVLVPVRSLADQLRAAASPALRARRITASGPLELAELGRDAEAMRSELVSRIDALEGARSALADQAPLVDLMRASLAPPDAPEFVALRCEPAEGVLAGDWVDCQQVASSVFVVVGDVAGHGPGPALTALRLRDRLRASFAPDADPAAILAQAASVFSPGQRTREQARFASVFLARVDLSASGVPSRVLFASAGHPPALLLEPGLQQPRLLEATGPVLSSLGHGGWRSQELALPPGASLLAFSDGVSELRLPSDQERSGWSELGEERAAVLLASSLERSSNVQACADDLLASLRSLGDAWWGRDDVTLALLRVPS